MSHRAGAPSDADPTSDLPELLPALPIFPLANCVLLPGGVLPLHVFEPRYRDLTRAALAGDNLMAIAHLRPGYEPDYEGRPPVRPIAGVGRIICSDELPDGRFMLLLQGVGRIQIERELPPDHSYRTVVARVLHDQTPGDAPRFAATYARLRQLCDQLAHALETNGQRGGAQLRELVTCDGAPGACADAVAAAIVTDVPTRRRLLEDRCPESRIRGTIDAVTSLLCALAPCDGDVN